MYFSYPVEVDANTTAVSPKRLKVGLCVGILQKINVYFPWGCAGLVGVRILHYEHQLCPTNPDEWLTGDGILIEFESEYWIMEGPNEWKIETYNVDDFYQHTPVIGFSVLRSGLAVPQTTGWIGA